MMRRKLMLNGLGLSVGMAALALCLAVSAGAQTVDSESPDYHELRLDLKATGVMTQHVVVTKIKTTKGKTTKGSAVSDYDLTYTETDTGYDVTKVLTKFSLGDEVLAGATDAEAKQASTMLQKIAMANATTSYTADESLTPVSVKDWEGIKTRMGTAMVDLMTVGSGEKPTPAQLTQMIDGMFGHLTSETAAQVVLEPDFLIALPHNVGLELNVPVTSDGQVEAPLGGDPLDAKESLILTQWDEAKNTAHVIYEFEPTPASVLTYLKDVLPKLMTRFGAPQSEIDGFRAQLSAGNPADIMTIKTHCDYDMAIDTGTITKGTCTKTVTTNIDGDKGGTVQISDFSEAFKN